MSGEKRPLTDKEHNLIRAAERYPWNPVLCENLRKALLYRDVRVASHASAGDMVEALELAAGGDLDV